MGCLEAMALPNKTTTLSRRTGVARRSSPNPANSGDSGRPFVTGGRDLGAGLELAQLRVRLGVDDDKAL